jgi:hypothetical protein
MKITLKLLLVIFLFVTCSKDEDTFSCSESGYTCIPDLNFEKTLIELGIDTDGTINGHVLTSDVSGITELDIWNDNISDLTGIEDFTSLTFLNCGRNQLTSLDVSNNKSLDWLNCYVNQLTSLDVSNNTSLIDLYCGSNQLTSLDVSNNTSLKRLNCSESQLTSLDVSNNTSLYLFDCQSNPLTCITVNQTQLDNIPTSWEKDSEDTYSIDCN